MQISVYFKEAKDIKTYLQVSRKLGSGKFNVYHAKALSQDIEFALKVFPKNWVSTKTYLREKLIRSLLNHENIVRDFSVTNHSLDCNILLSEYAPFGSFYDFITKVQVINDKLVRTYFHQLVDAVEYLHSKDVAHLDLKLENLLLGKNFRLKVSDFDQSQFTTEKEQICGGTLNYRAPEIRKGVCKDFFAADIYSMGIILYVMKTRGFPLAELSKCQSETLNEKNFEEECLDLLRSHREVSKRKNGFTESFQLLMDGMLRKDPAQRFSIQDIKSSTWYNEPVFDKKNLKIEMERIYERLCAKC